MVVDSKIDVDQKLNVIVDNNKINVVLSGTKTKHGGTIIKLSGTITVSDTSLIVCLI